MEAYQPTTTASLRLAEGVVDNVEIVVSGVVVVENVDIAVVPVEVSEENENVAVRGEERGVVSDFFVTHESEAHGDHISGFRGRGNSDRRGDGERGRGGRGRGRGRGGE